MACPRRTYEITNNIVTGYSGCHYDQTFYDGISISNENAFVDHNEIVDASDVGITLFRSRPDVVQNSLIQYNTIIAAGTPRSGAVGADPGSAKLPKRPSIAAPATPASSILSRARGVPRTTRSSRGRGATSTSGSWRGPESSPGIRMRRRRRGVQR